MLGSNSHKCGAEQKEAGGFEKRSLPLFVGSDRTCSHAWSILGDYRTISD